MSSLDIRFGPGFDTLPEANPTPSPGKSKREKKRRRRPRFLGGGFSFLSILLVCGALVGGLAAFGVYRHVVADLPDYRWLADYQPSQMSRIYAADSKLMAELATERRVFVPIEAIPTARPGRLHQRRGPALLGAPGRRPDRHPARRDHQHRAVRHRRRHGRRLHHHPAGRQEHAGRRRPHHDAQGARGDPGDPHRGRRCRRSASSSCT